MTLQTYSIERIDELALRMLDLSALMRQISNQCRENDMDSFPLHDKKALEWLAQLEQWALEGNGKVQAAILSQKAVQRAMGPGGGKKPRGKK